QALFVARRPERDGYARRKPSHGQPGPETSQPQSHATALTSVTPPSPPAIGKSTPGATGTGDQLKPISWWAHLILFICCASPTRPQ
ncbi:hypothetical protein P692DRAFT_20760737, partial [Suillus brevipes Sb2]